MSECNTDLVSNNIIECGIEIQLLFNSSLLIPQELPYLDNLNTVIDNINIGFPEWNVRLLHYNRLIEVATIQWEGNERTDKQILLSLLTGQFTTEIVREDGEEDVQEFGLVERFRREGRYTFSLFEYIDEQQDEEEEKNRRVYITID